MKKSRMSLAIFFALLLLLPAVGWHNAEATEIPYFLNRFEDTPLDLKQYWGKAYLLFFFTEASEECARQLPEVKRIFETYSSDALQVILIHEWVGENDTNTQNVIEKFGLHEMTFFEDRDQSVLKKVYPRGVPVMFFMDAGGFLHDAVSWYIPYEIIAEVVDAMGVPLAPPAPDNPAETESRVTVPPAPVQPEPSDAVMAPTNTPTPTPSPADTEPPFITRAPTSSPVTVTLSPANTGAPPLTPPP